MAKPHLLGAAVLLLAAPPSAAQPVTVTKVEPPSWWAGHSLNPVRLLVRGRGLSGARVEAEGGGLRAGEVKVNAAGSHLFVDVAIDPQAAAGRRRLRVLTPAGRAGFDFEVLAPLPRDGRFQGFTPDDVIYLIMPDRFANGDPRNDDPPDARGLLDRARGRHYHGGDLAGIAARLPYLKDLGVTALWLNPWYDNADHLNERQRFDGAPITDYHGYGAVDFYAVDEHLGDLPALRALVDEAHRHGIKVIQDQIANHCGPYHPWVQDPPTPTWLNGTPAAHRANTWQTWTLMDPGAAPELREETLSGWFADVLPDLNQDDPEAARYIIQNSLWWVGLTGLDGIRQDTLPYVPRRLWREWTAALRREHPRLTVVGELLDGDPALVAFFQGGAARFDGIDTGIDTLFDFPLYFAVRRVFAQGQPVRELAVVLAHDHLYPRPGSLVTFLGLHDVRRFVSEPGADAGGLKLAFTFLLTTRGTPLIYYGDEIGLPGGDDPDNRRDFPGGWPGDPRDAFTAAGRTPDEQSVFDHVRRVARLRAELPALRRGALLSLAVSDTAYAYARVLDSQAVVVAINNAREAATLDVPVASLPLPEGTVLEDRLGAAAQARAEGARLKLTLPARSAGLWVREQR
jgi:neopullulanase